MDTSTNMPLPDNAALAWLIAKDRPHYSPATLAKAVRIEDRRDTIGRKRADRTRRAAWSADCECAELVAAPQETAPIVSQAIARFKDFGLEVLIPHLMNGASIREACELAGLKKSTVCDRIASIRAQLSAELVADSE